MAHQRQKGAEEIFQIKSGGPVQDHNAVHRECWKRQGNVEKTGKDKTMTKHEKEREEGTCFLPEEHNPYPLCIGRGRTECEECQRRADWEPSEPYGSEI